MSGFVDDLEFLGAAAREGDATAHDDVVERVRPFVENWCRARLGPADGVQDVSAHVLAHVAVEIGRPDPGAQPFFARIVTITSEHADAAYRTAPDLRGPGSELPSLLARLAPAERGVLILRVIGRLSLADTAAALGTTTEPVRRNQHDALTALRTLVASRAPVP